MKVSRLKYIAFCFFLLSGIILHAQVRFVNEFLNIGVGAKSHGMFGSVTASVDDVTAGYWNPAGLSRIEDDFQVSAMHASWFGGIANYDYVGLGKKLGGWRNEAFGSVTLIRMGVDNIPNTINLIGPDGSINYDNVTEFSAADYAMLFSYGRVMFDTDINMGVTAKIIHRSLGDFGNAWGFGFDLGAQLVKEKVSFGLMLRDITTTVNVWSFDLNSNEQSVFLQTGNEIPSASTEIALPKLIASAAFFGGEEEGFSYLAEMDLRFSTDGTESGIFSGDGISIDPSIGMELGYNSTVFLRAGLGNIQRTLNEVNSAETSLSFQPNVGLGMVLGRLKVDYALTNIGSVSGVLVSHVFSLTVDFKK